MTTNKNVNQRHSDDPDSPPNCAWCGGACDQPRPFPNRRGEVFCSPSHRATSNAALRRFNNR
jgi:hypothetical protein